MLGGSSPGVFHLPRSSSQTTSGREKEKVSDLYHMGGTSFNHPISYPIQRNSYPVRSTVYDTVYARIPPCSTSQSGQRRGEDVNEVRDEGRANCQLASRIVSGGIGIVCASVVKEAVARVLRSSYSNRRKHRQRHGSLYQPSGRRNIYRVHTTYTE